MVVLCIDESIRKILFVAVIGDNRCISGLCETFVLNFSERQFKWEMANCINDNNLYCTLYFCTVLVTLVGFLCHSSVKNWKLRGFFSFFWGGGEGRGMFKFFLPSQVQTVYGCHTCGHDHEHNVLSNFIFRQDNYCVSCHEKT